MKIFFLKRIRSNLLIGVCNKAGRNFLGRKTILTQSGGAKMHLRFVDYGRRSGASVLVRLERDINRTGFLGLMCSFNGVFSWFLLPHRTQYEIGHIFKGFCSVFHNDGTFLLKDIPNGNFISCVEVSPNITAKLARAAGVSCFLISKDKKKAFLKMNSGWLLKVSVYCLAAAGSVSNILWEKERIKNAGYSRFLGFRPKVRGVAMNPCDHAHGGGEGRGSPPAAHKTAFGKNTKVPTKTTKIHRKFKKLFKIF
jgi:large subunit ribosomal protein L2